MSGQGSNDDCYFYFYSSCTKGGDCPFRHCQAALGTETVCSLWREGRCFRDNCKFRHMESRINRGHIQCYWEDQPSGCLKPHCVFMHRKPRSNIHPKSGNEGLILPLSTATSQTSPSSKAAEVKELSRNSPCNPVESYSSNIDDSEMCPSSIPIEPIIFSFDNEESDSESASSTPMKSVSCDTKCSSVTVEKNLSDTLLGRNDDFGIKTLEQIKMEKIHKESDNFYKLAYDAPLIDPLQIKMKADVFMPEIYPSNSDFISICERPIDNPVSVCTDSKLHSPENERSFKSRILKRRNVSLYSTSEKSVPPKKVVCLKRGKEDDNFDFKIKTLDEIRQEKINKSASKEVPYESTLQNISIVNGDVNQSSTSSNKNESVCINGRPFRRLKIRRQINESLSNISILQEADSSSDCQKKERNQMVLHEVQNISDDQNKADSKGKRKESQSSSADVRPAKQLKTNDLPKKATTAAESEERLVKCSRPIIKRKRSSSLLQTSVSPSKEVSSTVVKLSEPVLQKSEELHSESNTSSKKIIRDSGISDNEKRIPKTSVDEIDNFLLNEADVTLDYEPDGAINESDDILLEIEQLLES